MGFPFLFSYFFFKALSNRQNICIHVCIINSWAGNHSLLAVLISDEWGCRETLFVYFKYCLKIICILLYYLYSVYIKIYTVKYEASKLGYFHLDAEKSPCVSICASGRQAGK